MTKMIMHCDDSNHDNEPIEEDQNLSKKSRVEKTDWTAEEYAELENKNSDMNNSENMNESNEITAITGVVNSLLARVYCI